MHHDQDFKNLVLDYPREALAFFAEGEATDLPLEVRIMPLRQQQLQEGLGERFRELHMPLLVEWPDGQRAALLLVVEDADRPRPELPGVLHPPRPTTQGGDRDASGHFDTRALIVIPAGKPAAD